LWQSFPDAKSSDIANAIQRSARNYYSPDAGVGYGTANFILAYQYLKVLNSNELQQEVSLFPNPVEDYFTILVPNDPASGIEIKIFNSTGQLVKQESYKSADQVIFFTTISGLSSLGSGTYFLKVFTGEKTFTNKIIKL